MDVGLRGCDIWGNILYVCSFENVRRNKKTFPVPSIILFSVWYIGQGGCFSNVPCTQRSMFWGLADSHLHADSGKNMAFLAPTYRRPPFASVAFGGVDKDDAPIVATTFEPYLPS